MQEKRDVGYGDYKDALSMARTDLLLRNLKHFLATDSFSRQQVVAELQKTMAATQSTLPQACSQVLTEYFTQLAETALASNEHVTPRISQAYADTVYGAAMMLSGIAICELGEEQRTEQLLDSLMDENSDDSNFNGEARIFSYPMAYFSKLAEIQKHDPTGITVARQMEQDVDFPKSFMYQTITENYPDNPFIVRGFKSAAQYYPLIYSIASEANLDGHISDQGSGTHQVEIDVEIDYDC
jgi:hypothetical protein